MKHGPWVCAGIAAAALAALAGRAGAQRADAKAAAKAAYDNVVDAYMNSRWPELPKAQREAYRQTTRMTAEQRADVSYIRKTAPEFRPPWWKACKSTVQTKIRAKIWGRTILADFVPADRASVDGTINGMQRMQIKVSWNPSLVDNTSPQGGRVGGLHGLHRGDIGEVIVWRQLGQGYITVSLPIKTILALYRENRHLYQHLQAFYSNLTSMYHCSPKGRRAGMLLHASTLQGNASASEASMRSCRAIASLFAAIVLDDTSKWPSVKLPYSTPEENVEKKASEYILANFEPTWTLDEDRAFRTALRSFFRTNGERALKNRGKLMLPNHTVFMLMEPDDRTFQAQRDQWVAKQLAKAVK